MGDGDVEYLAWNAIDTPIRALRVSHVALRGMSSRQIFKNCILAARIASRFRQRLRCLGICNDVAVTRSPTAYNFGTVPIPLLREPLSLQCCDHSRLSHRSPPSNHPACRGPKCALRCASQTSRSIAEWQSRCLLCARNQDTRPFRFLPRQNRWPGHHRFVLRT